MAAITTGASGLLGERAMAPEIAFLQFAVPLADHLFDDPSLVDLPATALSATLRPLRNTVTAVRHAKDVVEEMRDEDDAAPTRPSGVRSTPKSCSTSGGDRADVGSSRMMMRAPENRTRASLDQLLQPDRQGRRCAVRGSTSSPRLVQLAPPVLLDASARHCDDPERTRGLLAQEHVFGDRQVGHDRQFLVNHADAGRETASRGRAEIRTSRPVDRHATRR